MCAAHVEKYPDPLHSSFSVVGCRPLHNASPLSYPLPFHVCLSSFQSARILFNGRNFLSSQEMMPDVGQEMRLTADTSSQTPADESPIESISTATDTRISTSPLAPAARPAWSPLSQRIVLGLLAVVVALLGTNVYSFNQTRAWKVRRLDCRCLIVSLCVQYFATKLPVGKAWSV